MLISGISVGVPHSHTADAARALSDDDHQVCFPADLTEWMADSQKGISDHGNLWISISSTGSPDAIAVAIGRPETVQDPQSAFAGGKAFGFIVGLATLRQLRGAIDAAIAAVR